jgi:hypothetical protein
MRVEVGRDKSYGELVITLNAHFDGRYVILDEPASLKPNAKVKVIAADDATDGGSVARDFARLSEDSFHTVWDNPPDVDYDKL